MLQDEPAHITGKMVSGISIENEYLCLDIESEMFYAIRYPNFWNV